MGTNVNYIFTRITHLQKDEPLYLLEENYTFTNQRLSLHLYYISFTNYTFVTNLHAASQGLVQDVCSPLHNFHIMWSGVRTLTVRDGIHEAIGKFLSCAKQTWLHKVYHTMI